MFDLGRDKRRYRNTKTFRYYSARYHKFVTVEEGMPSDGATGGLDVCDRSFYTHDKLCNTGKFDDGTPCTNWQASTIHSDILKDCAKKAKFGKGKVLFNLMAIWRWPATWLFGGGKCRDNGMFNKKNKI